jgi:hypothetical protein
MGGKIAHRGQTGHIARGFAARPAPADAGATLVRDFPMDAQTGER